MVLHVETAGRKKDDPVRAVLVAGPAEKDTRVATLAPIAEFLQPDW
jgi:hypothetical protein